MSFWWAKCLAVRQFTQDNRGKRAPGFDGLAALEPVERLALVSRLSLDANRDTPSTNRRELQISLHGVGLYISPVASAITRATSSATV
jgi:hypothetical protein